MIHTHLDSGIFCVHSRRVSIRCFWTAFGPGRGRSRAARLGFCKCVKIWSKKKVQTINIIGWGGSTTWVREGGLSLNEFLAAIVLKWKFDHFRIEAEQPTPFPSPPSSDHLGTFQLFRGGPFPILGVYGCSSESRISQNAKRVTFKDWSSFRISYMKRDLFRSFPHSSFCRADSLWWSFCGLESRGRYPYFWFSGCQKRQLETTGEGRKWSLSLSGENLTALR